MTAFALTTAALAAIVVLWTLAAVGVGAVDLATRLRAGRVRTPSGLEEADSE
ncbi:hypothetical protein Htur_5083 (plasmid) [Haloterrigena turkmenica DSM 5511]|uniref:Uncharacterized protein n=1 Tax=Haloterrigena turkmenica (strain ATCC 51198 / DSM 5511 / JCM 9101 / NCIMB 13204 / VKM B-1734 / 4k) TaxID=543526 RepID=D2S3M3_HALTV|nr:hypothetical protein [Haloterrigena turkmenica]ADB63970.1 hypothetical protein Htur_5083 [Haloterrigena turkmenica DSM 5511]